MINAVLAGFLKFDFSFLALFEQTILFGFLESLKGIGILLGFLRIFLKSVSNEDLLGLL